VFKVKWIVRFQEDSPVEVEVGKRGDLDRLVAFCQGQLIAKRLGHPSDTPDGFLICDQDGKELRRWIALPIAPIEAIVPSKETSPLRSRSRSDRPRPI
jgi:hypothetical protein